MNVIAVDVGTTSVRLAIVGFCGEQAQEAYILASCASDISYRQDGCKFEQSSKEIWDAICECNRKCLQKAQIDPSTVRGIAFSATCSLVIEDTNSVCVHEAPIKDDIIMWMDHRAIDEAQAITSSQSKVLEQLGGVCSPEMSLAKLVWLSKHDNERLRSAKGFYELPDWLVHKCLGDASGAQPARSLCCVTCKWGYDARNKCHCDIMRSLQSGEWFAEQLGADKVLGPGTISGALDAGAAQDLGLIEDAAVQTADVIVATSLIDAHSGMLAMLSVALDKNQIASNLSIEKTFCSLAGTSSCHMLLTAEPQFTRGIWGPYKDVVIEGYHLLEAGQSLTGKLIEMCIELHAEGKMRLGHGEKMYEIIEDLNEQALSGGGVVTTELHVLPTYHGNRSPLANPRLRGGVYGLSTEREMSLLEHYLATVDSIVYEARHIMETLHVKLDTILLSGGLMKNAYYVQTLADVTRCRVICLSLQNVDFMVMGSGLLARNAVLNAAQLGQGEWAHSKPITRREIDNMIYKQLDMQVYSPTSEQSNQLYHDKRYKCYRKFAALSQEIDAIMNEKHQL